MSSIHTIAQSALASSANHFIKVAGVIHAFNDEDACWRFLQAENIVIGSDESSRRAKCFSRMELAA